MRAKLISLVVATLGVGSAHIASAADLYVKAPPLPVFSWTGFYVGGNFGAGFGTTTATDILATNGLPWVVNGGQWHNKSVGFTAGGQAGYNWQVGSLVLGVEGDIGYLGLVGSGQYPFLTTTTVDTHGGLFSTARGRLGYAFDHLLVYGTGGWFGADVGSTVNQSTGVIIHTSSTGFQSGWTAGGGLEWAFAPNWSFKGEYLHYDVGTTQIGGTFSGGGAAIQFFNIKNTGDMVRTGINYRF
jgi:outer membrane immunogenic protein